MVSNSRNYTFTTHGDLDPVRLDLEISGIFNFWNNHEQGLQTHTITWTQQFWIAPTVLIAAGPYTALTTDCVLIVNQSVGAAFTLNLCATLQKGRVVIIKDGKGDANTNNITVQGNGKNIDGASSKVINTSYGVLRLIYNGTEWSSI